MRSYSDLIPPVRAVLSASPSSPTTNITIIILIHYYPHPSLSSSSPGIFRHSSDLIAPVGLALVSPTLGGEKGGEGEEKGGNGEEEGMM